MVTSKRRKTPVTGTGTKVQPSSAKTRTVIRKFHVLLKSRRKIEGQPGNGRELDAIDKQMSSLGGLDAYQGMSKQGQSAERGGGTETVLIDWLKDIVKDDPLGDGQKLRCVGDAASSPAPADGVSQGAGGGGSESGQLSRVFFLDREHAHRPQCAGPRHQAAGFLTDDGG